MIKIVLDYFHTGKSLYNLLIHRNFFAKVKIKNKKLAGELQNECDKREGILTYSEYVQIEQCGGYGYLANYEKKGLTNVGSRWGEALANFCISNNFKSIIEFGCGNGDLGIEIIKASAKKSGDDIHWTGIEINSSLHKIIKSKFEQEKIKDKLFTIVSTIDNIKFNTKAVVIFPYSLDSIAPEIFVCSNTDINYPDSMVGIKIQNGILSEEIISQAILEKKKIFFEKGVFKNATGMTYDLNKFKLRKGQRVYLPVNAFDIFMEYVQKMPKENIFFIIDEFRRDNNFGNFGITEAPKSLYENGEDCVDIARYYREAGKHYCYYPVYTGMFYKFLHQAGFRSIIFKTEQEAATEMTGKRWFSLKTEYYTCVFIAKDRRGEPKDIISLRL